MNVNNSLKDEADQEIDFIQNNGDLSPILINFTDELI
jgi:hypothetical protein